MKTIKRSELMEKLGKFLSVESGYCKRWCGKNAQQRRRGLENGAYTLITD